MRYVRKYNARVKTDLLTLKFSLAAEPSQQRNRKPPDNVKLAPTGEPTQWWQKTLSNRSRRSNTSSQKKFFKQCSTPISFSFSEQTLVCFDQVCRLFLVFIWSSFMSVSLNCLLVIIWYILAIKIIEAGTVLSSLKLKFMQNRRTWWLFKNLSKLSRAKTLSKIKWG